jgi:hypothetical protein
MEAVRKSLVDAGRSEADDVDRPSPFTSPRVRGFRSWLLRPPAAVSAVALLPGSSSATEMRGVTATEIKIGQTMPYSGPVSAFGALAFPSYAHE